MSIPKLPDAVAFKTDLQAAINKLSFSDAVLTKFGVLDKAEMRELIIDNFEEIFRRDFI